MSSSLTLYSVGDNYYLDVMRSNHYKLQFSYKSNTFGHMLFFNILPRTCAIIFSIQFDKFVFDTRKNNIRIRY